MKNKKDIVYLLIIIGLIGLIGQIYYTRIYGHDKTIRQNYQHILEELFNKYGKT